MSSMMIKLFEMSRSFKEVDYLITSANIVADLPEILMSDMWQTLIVLDYKRDFEISNPHSSPI